MKTQNIFKLAMLVVFAFTINSCVEEGDYSIPSSSTITPPPAVTVTNTIQQVKDMYTNGVVDFSVASNNGALVVEGYVVSSDEAGNIYKTLYIQDKPENPTAAIRIAVDATDMYTFYDLGRKVYVRLNDPTDDYFNSNKLGMTDNRGVLEIGKLNGTEVERIPSTDYKKIIVRDNVVSNIVPVEISDLSTINDSQIGMFVKLTNMQALDENQTYANLNDTFSVNRLFKSCTDDSTIIMRNSGFADFKSQAIPNLRGNISAVLGKYNSDYQIVINDTDNVEFVTDRCEAIFEDKFETYSFGEIDQIWTNYIEAGTRSWSVFSDSNSLGKSARIGSFRSGDASSIAWLITPAIDLDAQADEIFSFMSSNSFADGSELEVLISTDWDGTEANITSATWTALPANVVPDNTFWRDWVSSGDVSLSSYSGTAHIAFKYIGSGASGMDGTYEIDNISVRAL